MKTHPLRVPKNRGKPQITQISQIYKKGTHKGCPYKHIIPLPWGGTE